MRSRKAAYCGHSGNAASIAVAARIKELELDIRSG
jgi:hypothetical protein